MEKRIDIEIIKDNYYNLLGNNVILKLKASEDISWVSVSNDNIFEMVKTDYVCKDVQLYLLF